MKRVTNGDIRRKGASFWPKIIRLQTATDSLNLFSCSSEVNVRDDKVQGIILNISNHSSIL